MNENKLEKIKMKYLSTFSGIGGFELAIHDKFPGAECVAYFEWDKHADKTLVKNFPNLAGKNLGDIERFVFDLDKKGNYVTNVQRVSLLPDFDGLFGGSPCQDFSIAKAKREGLDGAKSRLFFAYLEILRIKKPKFFILENVSSMSKENKKKITEYLKEVTGNQDLEPMEICSSRLTGQKRKRIFWFPWKVEQPEDAGIKFKDVLEKITTNEYDLSEKELTYMDKTVKDGRNHWDFHHHHDSINDKSQTLVANLSKGVPYNVLIERVTPLAWSKSGREWGQEGRYTDDGKANTITTGDGGASQSSRNIVVQGNGDVSIVRKLTPIECERLQSFPDGWTEGVSKTQRYKQLGNAVSVVVVKHILKGLSL